MSAFGLFFPVEHEGKEDSSVTVTQLTQNDQNLEKKKKKRREIVCIQFFCSCHFKQLTKT